ncbi:MAG: hypothetical protein R3E75_03120 [Steroidobacteraceae bacterium]
MKRRTLLTSVGGAAAVAGAGLLGWRFATGTAGDYDAYASGLRAPLGAKPELAELIRYATLAANGHNTQPWRFQVLGDRIDILPDPARATPIVDPDDHHLFVSLGCAAENLRIAAAASGRPGAVEANIDGSVTYRFEAAVPQVDPLLQAIPLRQSTRSVYDGRAVAADELEALQHAAAVPGVRIVLLTGRMQIDRLRDLVVAGNDLQMNDAAFMAELREWLRFSPRRAMATGDGLYSAATGNPVLPEALGRRAFDSFVTAAAENDRYARQIDSSAGLAVFLAERADRPHWVAVGQACQRFALTATRFGLKQAFVNQPVEVAGLRTELAALVGEPGLRPDLLMRFGRGPSLPFSPRRPVSAVLT